MPPLSRQQQISLCLAGTVALPSPFPTVGRIETTDRTNDNDNELVKVTHEITTKRLVAWLLPLGEICAYCADPLNPDNYDPTNWYLAKEAQDHIVNSKSVTGVVFVKEECGLLVCSEASTTAGESVHLYSDECSPDD